MIERILNYFGYMKAPMEIDEGWIRNYSEMYNANSHLPSSKTWQEYMDSFRDIETA